MNKVVLNLFLEMTNPPQERDGGGLLHGDCIIYCVDSCVWISTSRLEVFSSRRLHTECSQTAG